MVYGLYIHLPSFLSFAAAVSTRQNLLAHYIVILLLLYYINGAFASVKGKKTALAQKKKTYRKLILNCMSGRALLAASLLINNFTPFAKCQCKYYESIEKRQNRKKLVATAKLCECACKRTSKRSYTFCSLRKMLHKICHRHIL